jgi:hypothetical protein
LTAYIAVNAAHRHSDEWRAALTAGVNAGSRGAPALRPALTAHIDVNAGSAPIHPFDRR